MAGATGARAAEWRAYWPLVIATAAGFSFNSMPAYATGLLMEPLQHAFGWSRAVISAGLTVGAFVSVLLSAPVGALIDRWGARRIALPGLVLASLCFASFGLVNGSPGQWIGLWVMYALIALSTKSTVWTCAVAGTFSAGRSLAIAVTLSGAALAQILVPPLANWLIVSQGWRAACMWLGLGWGGAAFVLAILFLFDRRDRARSASLPVGPPIAMGGLTLRQALRDPALLRIAASSVVTMLIGVAAVVHQVPILTEAGVTRAHAALLASVTGVAGIAGKLVTGWAMERPDGAWVGSATLAASAVGFLLLLEPFRTPVAIVAAMSIIGWASGSKLHICAYLTSRYAGLRQYGAIFGVMSSLIALGSGLGPVVAGAVYDRAGSYAPFMIAAVPLSLLCGLLIFRLGAYPDWSDPPVAETGPVAVPLSPPPLRAG